LSGDEATKTKKRRFKGHTPEVDPGRSRPKALDAPTSRNSGHLDLHPLHKGFTALCGFLTAPEVIGNPLPAEEGATAEPRQRAAGWLSLYQRHGSGLPVLSDGAFVRFDADGRQLDTKLCRHPVRGSYETAIFLRCDGETVWFDGNVSRFGRPDNVFGFTFREALIKVNRILLENHLPPFSEGQRFITNLRGNPRSEWTGATITRVDITQNFSAGSKADASYFMA